MRLVSSPVGVRTRVSYIGMTVLLECIYGGLMWDSNPPFDALDTHMNQPESPIKNANTGFARACGCGQSTRVWHSGSHNGLTLTPATVMDLASLQLVRQMCITAQSCPGLTPTRFCLLSDYTQSWCPGRDSNSHGFLHCHLKTAWLPLHHLG